MKKGIASSLRTHADMTPKQIEPCPFEWLTLLCEGQDRLSRLGHERSDIDHCSKSIGRQCCDTRYDAPSHGVINDDGRRSESQGGIADSIDVILPANPPWRARPASMTGQIDSG